MVTMVTVVTMVTTITMVTMVTMITMVTIVTDVLNPEPTHCPCGLYLGIAWLPQLLTNDKPT